MNFFHLRRVIQYGEWKKEKESRERENTIGGGCLGVHYLVQLRSVYAFIFLVPPSAILPFQQQRNGASSAYPPRAPFHSTFLLIPFQVDYYQRISARFGCSFIYATISTRMFLSDYIWDHYDTCAYLRVSCFIILVLVSRTAAFQRVQKYPSNYRGNVD